VKGLLKSVPGTPADRLPLWLDPDPYYGPKDPSQDLAGLAMEKKYYGDNLGRHDKVKVGDTWIVNPKRVLESIKKTKADEAQGKKEGSGS